MEKNVAETPKNLIKDVRLNRLSSIYFNLSITCLVISIIAMFSSFIIPVFYGVVMVFSVCALLLMFVLVIVTFGLILLIPNNPIKGLLNFLQNSNSDKIVNISQKFFSALPYFCIGGLVFAIISIIALVFSKEKKVGKIIGLSVVAVIMTFVLIFYYTMGGKLWQS